MSSRITTAGSISVAELENGIFDGRTVLGIPKGYYNVFELDKKAFRPLGAELSLHAPTGRLQISSKKRLVLDRGLADLLGFSREVSMSENLQNSRPSILLKSIPVKNKRCGGGRTETFPVLQYKRLASGPLSQLTLTILDMGGSKLGFDYLSAVLHIRRNGGRSWPRERQEMPLGGFSRSLRYRGIRKGWGRGPAVRFQAVLRGVQTKKGHHPRGRWGREAQRVERRKCFICCPQMAPPVGVYWEQVGRLRGPRSRNGLDDRHLNLLSLRCNGAASQGSKGDE